MKFTPEVIAALAVLRNAAENDFERHRLDVLERDLTSPPVVEQVDDTHQSFNGEIYLKNNSEHYCLALPIHRVVWQYYNGKIPPKMHIHHIDHNKANNEISNLQMLTSSEHARIHRVVIEEKKYICEVCGKEFISKSHSCRVRYCSVSCRNSRKNLRYREIRVCAHCGKEFSALKRSPDRFCSRQCANQSRTHTITTKTCPICGKEFQTKSARKCCSQHCSGIAASQKRPRRAEKICPLCGKRFIPSHSEQVCCSLSCGVKFGKQKKKSTMPSREKICPVCNKKFLPKKSNQIYCSRSCASKAINKKNQKC